MFWNAEMCDAGTKVKSNVEVCYCGEMSPAKSSVSSTVREVGPPYYYVDGDDTAL